MDIFKSKGMVDFYQKVVEAEKFAYAQRGLLGDPDFLPKKNISKVSGNEPSLLLQDL